MKLARQRGLVSPLPGYWQRRELSWFYWLAGKVYLTLVPRGPVKVAGEVNSQTEEFLRKGERRESIELMSAGSASIFDKPYLPVIDKGEG